MKKRICCITIALCIALAAGCSKAAKTDAAALPEVRNNGTAIQWRYPAEEEWRDLVALTELRGAAGENGKDGADGKNGVDEEMEQTEKTALTAPTVKTALTEPTVRTE